VGHQDRRQDEDRRQDHQHLGHQGHLRLGHQYVDRQDHPGHQYEEQNQYVDHQDHQDHQCEDHLGHQYEDRLDHQDQDDCQDQDGNQRHQGRGVGHQDLGGNRDEIHQGLHGRLEEEEWVDQWTTLDLEEAEWAERREHLDHEAACRLVAYLEELIESTVQVALTASD
jgi:hypothetical protein